MARTDDVGARIRRRRQELGLTQEELAAHVGVSARAVIRWEADRNFPTRHQGRLEAVLGIRLDGGRYAMSLPALADAYRRETHHRRSA
jgi:transcriptional regulator with XRE-family HTH domain